MIVTAHIMQVIYSIFTKRGAKLEELFSMLITVWLDKLGENNLLALHCNIKLRVGPSLHPSTLDELHYPLFLLASQILPLVWISTHSRADRAL
jgi:hypothetical protein